MVVVGSVVGGTGEVVVVAGSVVVVVVDVVVVGGVTEHEPAGGGVTEPATTFTTVPFCTSKIGPVGDVSSNTMGEAALSPAIDPLVVVVPLKRYCPEPVTEPGFVKSPPMVMASGPWV